MGIDFIVSSMTNGAIFLPPELTYNSLIRPVILTYPSASISPLSPECNHPSESIVDKKWPEAEKILLEDDTLNIAIQINGKLRSEIEINKNTSEEEVKSTALLDDKVKKYLAYFNDERSNITIRDLLNMSSGLDFPEHEHERMFFQKDHLDYARKVGVEKDAGIKWEYNNVNSMIIGDILYSATGKKADILLKERILKPLNINSYKLWKDETGNVLAYCCVDMSARDYSKIGLLFARDGYWNGKKILSKDFIDETFQVVWGFSDDSPRSGYSLHWWVGKHDDKSKIFHTAGKFGQYTFVDRENDIVVTRITKYQQKDHGDIQKWGPLGYFRWLGVEQAVKTARILLNFGLVEEGIDVITPTTEEEGESKEFVVNFEKFVDQIANLSN